MLYKAETLFTDRSRLAIEFAIMAHPWFSGLSSYDYDFLNSMTASSIANKDDWNAWWASKGYTDDALIIDEWRNQGYRPAGGGDDNIQWLIYHLKNTQKISIFTYDQEGDLFDFTWDLSGFLQASEEIESICPPLTLDGVESKN